MTGGVTPGPALSRPRAWGGGSAPVRLVVGLLFGLLGFVWVPSVSASADPSYDAAGYSYDGGSYISPEPASEQSPLPAAPTVSVRHDATGDGGIHLRRPIQSVAPSAALDDAASAANGARLNAQLAAEEIASGHAFTKHVVTQGEFPGIRTRDQFADMVETVITDYTDIRHLDRGRTAYWRDGVVVIRNPSAADGGTAFVPRDGYDYFLNDLN